VLAGYCYDQTSAPPYGLWRDLPPALEPLAQPGGVEALGGREALFALTRDALAALARQRPLVLLLEDLHWADAASLDLLRHLARHLAALPLLVVATYRPPGAARYPVSWPFTPSGVIFGGPGAGVPATSLGRNKQPTQGTLEPRRRSEIEPRLPMMSRPGDRPGGAWSRTTKPRCAAPIRASGPSASLAVPTTRMPSS
jgi:hypothetical protein